MRTSLTARSLAGGLRAARARVPRVVSRCPVGSSGTAAAAARWTRPGAPLPALGCCARAQLKSGGEGRFVRPVEDKSPRADDDIYWDPADLEDEPPAMQFDFDDDDEEDDDDDWFFVPEGAMGNVKDAEEDLFVVGEDYDDDEFWLRRGFRRFRSLRRRRRRRLGESRGEPKQSAPRAKRTLRRTRGIRTRAEEAAKRRNSPLSRWRNSARGRRTRFVCSRWECPRSCFDGWMTRRLRWSLSTRGGRRRTRDARTSAYRSWRERSRVARSCLPRDSTRDR